MRERESVLARGLFYFSLFTKVWDWARRATGICRFNPGALSGGRDPNHLSHHLQQGAY